MNIINHFVNIYYIMVLGYAFYYLVLSFRAELPWEKCGSWASPSMWYLSFFQVSLLAHEC